MRSISIVSSILSLAVIGSASSDGGAWPRKQGAGFVQLGFSTIGYNKVYDDDGFKYPIYADVRDNVIQAFVEYGVTDNVTVGAAIPYKFISVKPSSAALAPFSSDRDNSGIGDVDITMRYGWFNFDGCVLSTALWFGMPSGDSKNTDGLLLGDGEFNVGLSLAFGKSFYPDPLYVSGDLTFDRREKGFSDEFLYDLEIGYGLLDGRLYIVLLLSGKESTSSVPSRTFAASALGLSTNNQEYTAIIPKLVYKFSDHWGASISYGTATHGRNIAGGAVVAGGIYFEFK